MLNAFSKNIQVASKASIPFNAVSLKKGNSVCLSGTSTIQLNKKGIYEVLFDAEVATSDDGELNINLVKNDVIQPQASVFIPCPSPSVYQPISMSTLVQVCEDNTCCCVSCPVVLQFNNAGAGIEISNASVVVTKIC